jgi:hypothetical protein
MKPPPMIGENRPPSAAFPISRITSRNHCSAVDPAGPRSASGDKHRRHPARECRAAGGLGCLVTLGAARVLRHHHRDRLDSVYRRMSRTAELEPVTVRVVDQALDLQGSSI